MSKPLWEEDPVAWREITLVDRLETMRHFHCTGPCGQSSSVMAARSTLNAVFLEAIQVAQELRSIKAALRVLDSVMEK